MVSYIINITDITKIIYERDLAFKIDIDYENLVAG